MKNKALALLQIMEKQFKAPRNFDHLVQFAQDIEAISDQTLKAYGVLVLRKYFLKAMLFSSNRYGTFDQQQFNFDPV